VQGLPLQLGRRYRLRNLLLRLVTGCIYWHELHLGLWLLLYLKSLRDQGLGLSCVHLLFLLVLLRLLLEEVVLLRLLLSLSEGNWDVLWLQGVLVKCDFCDVVALSGEHELTFFSARLVARVLSEVLF